jgi:hypothetical protein
VRAGLLWVRRGRGDRGEVVWTCLDSRADWVSRHVVDDRLKSAIDVSIPCRGAERQAVGRNPGCGHAATLLPSIATR